MDTGINPFVSGDQVRYTDGDPRTFTVHTVYDGRHVSLGLHDHPDTEQDHKTHVSKIELISANK